MLTRKTEQPTTLPVQPNKPSMVAPAPQTPERRNSGKIVIGDLELGTQTATTLHCTHSGVA